LPPRHWLRGGVVGGTSGFFLDSFGRHFAWTTSLGFWSLRDNHGLALPLVLFARTSALSHNLGNLSNRGLISGYKWLGVIAGRHRNLKKWKKERKADQKSTMIRSLSPG
jgi:hypothetical protein